MNFVAPVTHLSLYTLDHHRRLTSDILVKIMNEYTVFFSYFANN